MGVGATNTVERMAASLGGLGSSEIKFEPALDVPNGGVLLALPALSAVGLLRHTEKFFKLTRGFYQLSSIFLLLAFLALARIKFIENLRFEAPGEWGKLLGLDRIPEVKTLRRKLACLSQDGNPQQWSAELCSDWMGNYSGQELALFYLDGHVRLYHGSQTKLPRRYVSRQKLCLRGSTDYWVNGIDSQPFLVIYKDVDPGLIKTLENDVIPHLERNSPNQPTKKELEADPQLHRFTVVFDREGFSSKLFRNLKDRRIACLTYRKFPGLDWKQEEFSTCNVKLTSGETVEMKLAERGVLLGAKKDEKIWVRELRRLMPGGHQISMVSTNYKADITILAQYLVGRWCQENYFKYMKEHFNLDRLASYQTEDLPPSSEIVNPEYRKLDREIRNGTTTLNQKKVKYLDLKIPEDLRPRQKDEKTQKKAKLKEEIDSIETTIHTLKETRKKTRHHITLAELPEEERFKGLAQGPKHLLDAVKMIAYRAETAMAQIIRSQISRKDDARSILRALYANEADLHPDYEQNILRVKLHRLANRATDTAVRYLCAELTETETKFPGTELRLVYELVES
jgi:hypothetical protein